MQLPVHELNSIRSEDRSGSDEVDGVYSIDVGAVGIVFIEKTEL